MRRSSLTIGIERRNALERMFSSQLFSLSVHIQHGASSLAAPDANESVSPVRRHACHGFFKLMRATLLADFSTNQTLPSGPDVMVTIGENQGGVVRVSWIFRVGDGAPQPRKVLQEVAATLYTLVETAKLHGVNPVPESFGIEGLDFPSEPASPAANRRWDDLAKRAGGGGRGRAF
jgi:hypothetical protein